MGGSIKRYSDKTEMVGFDSAPKLMIQPNESVSKEINRYRITGKHKIMFFQQNFRHKHLYSINRKIEIN